MGSLYPSPGIFSKYWTSDQEPLVEIIQILAGGMILLDWPVQQGTMKIWAILGTLIVQII